MYEVTLENVNWTAYVPTKVDYLHFAVNGH